jgi:hypothetical protein
MADGILRVRAMNSKVTFANKDVLAVLGCLLFLLANLGAVGVTGRRRAKEAVCVSNLKRWGILWKCWADDNGGFFMDRDGAVWWLKTMIEYSAASRNPKLWLCPEASRTGPKPPCLRPEGAVNPFMAWDDAIDLDEDPTTGIPEVPGRELYVKGSYSINLYIAKQYRDEYWCTPYIRGAGEVPMMLDGQWKDMEPFPTDSPLPTEWDIWTPGPTNEMRRACVNRHSGVNAVFWPEDFPLPLWPEWMQNFKDP